MGWILIVILAITSVVCAAGWLCQWVGSAALAIFMLEKQYTPPTDAELRMCISRVWLRLLHIKD